MRKGQTVFTTWEKALGPKRAAFMRAHYRELGKQGGTARAKSLTERQRSNIARKAARARWAKVNGK